MPVGPLSLWYVITISFVWSAPAGGLGAQGALAASQSGLHRRGHGGAVAIDAAGLGSIDLVTPNGQVPESVIRIFNDAGDAGTTGMSEEQIHRRSHAARRVAVDENNGENAALPILSMAGEWRKRANLLHPSDQAVGGRVEGRFLFVDSI